MDKAAPMTSDDMRQVMASIARRRPIFHSEADFQQALAWELQIGYPAAGIRLEVELHAGRSLDVLLRLPDQLVAIELKYLVKRQEVTVDGEEFRLKNQSAHDIRRYDTVKDITRIEELVEAGAVDTGFVIVASNDSAYWSQSRERSTPVNDAAFRLDDGRELAGELAWCATTGAGTMESREKPLVLTGAYSLAWDDFARVGDDLFRYLLISVR